MNHQDGVKIRMALGVACSIMLFCLTTAVDGQTVASQHSDTDSADELDFLLGEWTGTAALWFAPQTGRATVNEQGHMECRPELSDTYIQCRVRFSREGGREREMLIYYNHLPESGGHDVLFLFNSWEGKVSYRLTRDAEDPTLFTGSFTDTDDGMRFTEFIDLQRTDDGMGLRGWERIQNADSPTGSYEQTFEVFWRRVETAGGVDSWQ